MAATIHIHIHHRHCYYYLAHKLILIYRPTNGGRLSRPRHRSKGAQLVPKAAYHSGCRDIHNRPRHDSNLGPLTSQSDALTTRPLRLQSVYVTVGCSSVCPSVRLSRRSTAAATCGWFAAELGRWQQISIDSCRRRVPAVDRYLLPAPEPRLRVASCLRPEVRGSTQTRS